MTEKINRIVIGKSFEFKTPPLPSPPPPDCDLIFKDADKNVYFLMKPSGDLFELIPRKVEK